MPGSRGGGAPVAVDGADPVASSCCIMVASVCFGVAGVSRLRKSASCVFYSRHCFCCCSSSCISRATSNRPSAPLQWLVPEELFFDGRRSLLRQCRRLGSSRVPFNPMRRDEMAVLVMYLLATIDLEGYDMLTQKPAANRKLAVTLPFSSENYCPCQSAVRPSLDLK